MHDDRVHVRHLLSIGPDLVKRMAGATNSERQSVGSDQFNALIAKSDLPAEFAYIEGRPSFLFALANAVAAPLVRLG